MALIRRSPVGSGSVFDDEFGVGAAGDPTVLGQEPSAGASGPFSPPPPDDSPVPEAPPPPVVIPGRGGETPRERAEAGSGGGGTGSPGLTGGVAAPPRPRVPTPQAGTTMQPGMMPPPSINAPLPSIMSNRRSLLGGAGGLTMGGLGVPFDPTSNQKSDPISTLMELLGKKQVF